MAEAMRMRSTYLPTGADPWKISKVGSGEKGLDGAMDHRVVLVDLLERR
jgi:hypothetical protein